MASYSVGLPAGSPPPVRAATSMFLISFANILPRLASTTAFLCLVVAHLEWPLIVSRPSSSRGTGAPRHSPPAQGAPDVSGPRRTRAEHGPPALPALHPSGE